MIDKINDIIGRPYDAERFNCWHLVMELQPKAPKLEVVATKIAGLKNMNKKYYSGWEITTSPKDLDIVLLGMREDAMQHAAVYYKGGVIHADNFAVRFESLSSIQNKYSHVKFYTYSL